MENLWEGEEPPFPFFLKHLSFPFIAASEMPARVSAASFSAIMSRIFFDYVRIGSPLFLYRSKLSSHFD